MNLFTDGKMMVARLNNMTPDIKDIISLYEKFGSVWKVGKQIGICGQAVHRRLNKAGIDTSRPPEFTPQQIERIKDYYTNTIPIDFDLEGLARELGKKNGGNVSRMAKRLGLSDPSRPLNRKQLAAVRQNKWQNKPHPRGMAGKKHSEKNKAIFSASSKKMWATHKAFGVGLMSKESRENRSKRMTLVAVNRLASKNYTRTKGGYRKDLDNTYFRSSWEANYARYLNLLKKFGVVEYWDFEKEIFWFEGIKRGVTNYRPDFRVKYKNDPKLEYVEIKGWITKKDRTKWRRMKKYHPEIKLIVVAQKQYEAIKKKWSSAISEWEHPTRPNNRRQFKLKLQ